MASTGEEVQEPHYSPLSSDAETEPLPFDETASDGHEDDKMEPDTHPERGEHDTMQIDETRASNDRFSEGSELTEEGDSDVERTPQARPPQPPTYSDEEGSSLSEDEARETEASKEHSALDGLASLASSTPGVDQSRAHAIPPTSSTLSDDSSPEDANEDDDEGNTTIGAPGTPRKAHSTLRRAVIAAAGKRRAAATGGAPSLLVEPDPESSVPPSAATSRQNSPESEMGERMESDAEAPPSEAADEPEATAEEPVEPAEEDAAEVADDEDEAGDEGGADEDEKDAEAADADADADADAPVLESTEQDDVEAMQRRHEALDLLTRAEIGYAMLRDRLYNERMEELEAESEMIHAGTHPELQLLHTIIDTRKDRRLALLEKWLEQEEKERERWAKVEDSTAWVNWRDQAASVRRTLIDDTNRKRRKLDREKRLLDTPQPTRRHQPFEAELVRKPPAYSRRTQRDVDRFDYTPHRMPRDDINSFMAYPDLRGLEEYDVFVDMDQMGIHPMPPMYPNYVRQEEMAMQEMYPPYGPPPGSAPYAPPYGMPPGPYMDRGVPYDAPVPVDEYGAPLDARPMHEYDAPYPKAPYAPEAYGEPPARGYPPVPAPYLPPPGPAVH